MMGKDRTVPILLVGALIVIVLLGLFAYFSPALDTAKDKADVQKLVADFGAHLKNVPLSGTPDIARQAIQQNYSEYVSPALLEQWITDPDLAPGRLTSSPWP